MEGYIYITTNTVNGKQYVGQKSTTPEESIDYLGSGIQIKRAIKKYGKENFEKRIIQLAYSQDELDSLEEQFIREHDTLIPKGYNISGGGAKCIHNCAHSEDTKKKISEALTGKHHEHHASLNFTEEHKLNMSLAAKGKKKTEEHKKNLSIALKDRHLSDEHRERISAGQKGKPHPHKRPKGLKYHTKGNN